MSSQTGIRLVEMNETQHRAYLEASIVSYSKESPHYRDLPLEISLPKVRAEHLRLFGEKGIYEPGQVYLAVMSGDRQVGYLHYGERAESKSVYIWNIALDENMRGKGIGRKVLELALARIKNSGFTKVGLNVFSVNTPAIRLYESLGFKPTQMNMELKI